MRKTVCLLAVALSVCVAYAHAVLAQGLYDTNQQGSTISVTNTFQQVLPRDESRHGCTIQNNGSHVMYVYFGTMSAATTSNSFVMQAGGTILCVIGYNIIKAQVSITGTSGDAYVWSTQ